MALLSGHTVRTAAPVVLLWALAVPTAVAVPTALAVPTAVAVTPAPATTPVVTPTAVDSPSATPAWTARPASDGSGPSAGGRPYVYLEGAPGAVLEDRISVVNPGSTPLTVRLRSDGAYRSSDGAGVQLRLASGTVTVPARTRADVPFAVTVPQAAPPGDRTGAIVAGSGDREVAVRVHLRVGGPALAALTLEEVGVSGRTIHYTLVNRGNVPLVPRLAVGAEGMSGTLLRRAERTLPLELAPGKRVRLTEAWRDAPALDSVTVRLRVTARGGVHDEASASAVYVPRGPLTGGALLLVLAAIAVGAYRRGRRRRGPPARHDRPGQRTGSDRNLVKAGADT